MEALQFTAALDNVPVYVWPQHVVSVRTTRGDPSTNTPQGTLICTTAYEPDNRLVVTESINIVVQLINRSYPHFRGAEPKADETGSGPKRSRPSAA